MRYFHDEPMPGVYHCPFCERVMSTWQTMHEHLRYRCPDVTRKDKHLESLSPKGPSQWG